MTRVRTGVVLLVLALTLALPAVASASSPIDQMIGKVNQLRRQHGLHPLAVSGSLDHSATAYSEWMMSSGYFGHLSRIAASHSYHVLGEIIDYHSSEHPDVDWAFRDWLHSPEHLHVMLYPTFRFVGAGYTLGRFRGRRATLWVMHFGAH